MFDVYIDFSYSIYTKRYLFNANWPLVLILLFHVMLVNPDVFFLTFSLDVDIRFDRPYCSTINAGLAAISISP